MTELKDLATKCSPNWCPGCGNIAIWGAFKNAAVQKGWDNTNTAIVAGIGCHGHIVNFIRFTSFEGLHGRAIPVATGIKLANSRLNVFTFTGDGDCLAEGGNHFIHACRRNHNINVFIHDNAIYALTTGQTSPTSPHGFKTKSTPYGNPDYPINPVALAIASGATFVARAYAGDIQGTAELMIKANEHQGISILDILQPCVTFNKEADHTFYQKNIYKIDSSHDVTNKEAAFKKALEWGEKQIPIGIFYETSELTHESKIPQISDVPLIDNNPERKDLTQLFEEFV
jgi:2-oxoglutarate ferredoxin oxidoreductase subunit beta